MDQSANEVVHNAAASRYEVETAEGLAIAEYVRKGSSIIFTHTEVPGGARGGGVANALARRSLDDARAEGLSVVPSCPFYAAYVQRHPEYADIVRAPRRAEPA